MRHLLTTAATMAFALTVSAGAQDHPEHPSEHPAAAAPEVKPLTIGDKAPGIKIAKFFRGKPVTEFESGTTYVMEYWATWCGPCLAQIPHLAKLQKEYEDKDVRFVSTAIWQHEETQAEREKVVGDFVTAKGDAMAYTVAIDDDRWMADHWMKPAGQGGIPAAFLVGKTGEIEWIGHPGSIDPVLASYLGGTWDRAKAKAAFDEELRVATKSRELMMSYMMAQRSGDRAACKKALDALVKEFPTNTNVRLSQFEFLVSDPSTAGEGYTIARELMDRDGGASSGLLNYMAWHVVDDTTVARRDLDFALEAATKADALTDHKDASIIDTLARVYWEKGDKDTAVALQKDAIAVAMDHNKAELEATLASYQTNE
ncbi:MAG: redoxin family protein [Phycisphaerales bacterium]|jgi:thiol-disulfide isomerase/thioredoxin|nr:redoxin family protein [Phycisphaerales bacterium]